MDSYQPNNDSYDIHGDRYSSEAKSKMSGYDSYHPNDAYDNPPTDRYASEGPNRFDPYESAYTYPSGSRKDLRDRRGSDADTRAYDSYDTDRSSNVDSYRARSNGSHSGDNSYSKKRDRESEHQPEKRARIETKNTDE